MLYQCILIFLMYIPLLISRESSYPYLAGDTWRFFCDWRLAEHESFDPTQIKLGDTIFVEYDSLEEFAQIYLPKIPVRCILVTPNCERGSDNPLPGRFAYLLTSDKIIKWFLQNMDCEPHPKIEPIPIGLGNKIWEHGNTKLFDKYIPQALNHKKKSYLAYINFALGTNPGERGACLNYFRRQKYAVVRSAKPFKDYLKDLVKTAFVISPPGNGLDCHRTWEALLMGCYPIVKSSTLNPLYENLPVVIVENWNDVTEDFLKQKLIEFQSKTWTREKLFAPYWFQKVQDIQKELRR